MPIIPLFRPNSEAPVRETPALDRVQRPEVDFSAVQEGIAQLGKASRLPGVDGAPFEEVSRAWQSVGSAIQRTGSVIGAMYEQKGKAQDQVAKNKATLGMKEVAEGVTAYQQANPDKPQSWAKQATEAVGGFVKKLGGFKDVSPEARQEIMGSANKGGARLVIATETAAVKRINREAADGLGNIASGHFATGQYAEGMAALQQAGTQGLMHDAEVKHRAEQGYLATKQYHRGQVMTVREGELSKRHPSLELLESSIQQSPWYSPEEKKQELLVVRSAYEKRLQTTRVEDLIQSDPKAAITVLDDAKELYRLTPGEREEHRRVAYRAQEHMGNAEMRGVMDGYYQLRPEEQAKVKAEDLTSRFKQGGWFQKEMVGRALDIEHKRAPMNDASTYEALVAKIDQYRPDQAEAAMWKERLGIEMGVQFSGADLQKLQDRLEKREKAGNDAVDMGRVTSLLGVMRREGAFGGMPTSSPEYRVQTGAATPQMQQQQTQIAGLQRQARETVEDEIAKKQITNTEQALARMAQLALPGYLPQRKGDWGMSFRPGSEITK